MSIKKLVERAQYLQNELTKAKISFSNATEQLEQSKSHLHIVSGHLNEVSYQLEEAHKAEQLEKEKSDALEMEKTKKDEENGQAHDKK